MNMEKRLANAKAFLLGWNKKLEASQQRIQDIYEITMSHSPKSLAFLSFDANGSAHKFSYADWQNACCDMAAKIENVIAKDGLVAIKVKNSTDWPSLFYGLLMSGHSVLLLNASLAHANAQNLLKQSHAVAVVTDEKEDYDIASFTLSAIKAAQKKADFKPHWADEVVFCSSGTTGDAKMAIYNGKNLCAQVLASTAMPEVTADIMNEGEIRNFASLPFHHIFGFVAVFLWYTFYGKCLVFAGGGSTSDMLNAIKKGKVTHLYFVPLFWDAIAQNVTRSTALLGPKKVALLDKLVAYNNGKIDKKEAGKGASNLVKHAFQKKVLGTKIQYCISGGGYLSPKSAEIINGLGYPLYNGYGMTEVGVTSVELSPAIEDRQKYSIGKALHGIEYKIHNPGEDGCGELYIKSNITHQKQFIGGVLTEMKYEDGYFPTGDIVSIDKDGRVYIKGRMKDTIILSNGENVYPDEIEDYFKGVNRVKNVCVLGAKPSGEKEECICLIIEVDGSIKNEEVPAIKKEIKAINDSLPNEKKIVKYFVSRKPLPLSNAMKVKRGEIKKAIEEGNEAYLDFDGKKKPVNFKGYDMKQVEEIRSKVTKAFASVLLLPENKIQPDSEWSSDLNGDSMSYIEMVQELEKTFGVKIEDSLFGVLTTVNEFTKQIIDLKK